MSSVEQRKLERVRYWQGQKLRSRDFNNIHAVEEQRRWWHNRALHNAYGIEEGFEASLSTDNTGVVIQAGLAYDNAGRELILETEQTVTIPYTPGMDQDIVLCIRYRQEIPAPRENDLAAVCCTSTVPQFVEFFWRQKQSCGITDGVPLAEIQIMKGQKRLLVITRPSARPLSRPLLASGSTVPGNTAWELWSTDTERLPFIFGVQTTIDTSAAGFTDDPCYFAWLQGPVWSPQTQQIVPALFTSISDETLDSFTFRITLPDAQHFTLPPVFAGQNKVGPHGFALFAHEQNLYVNWVGCQKNASAPFLAILQRMPRFVLDLTLLQTILFRLNRL